jgi:acetone carboxylase gamma subunit
MKPQWCPTAWLTQKHNIEEKMVQGRGETRNGSRMVSGLATQERFAEHLREVQDKIIMDSPVLDTFRLVKACTTSMYIC